ncbi:GTP-binding protein 10-like isoform X1 [Scylla paramamosain]|uniref:GTP-binding protein 10-like isoform X1 n=1 Tax=Scylla paramamosain TaxID=85552 RepID=UPI0030827E54
MGLAFQWPFFFIGFLLPLASVPPTLKKKKSPHCCGPSPAPDPRWPATPPTLGVVKYSDMRRLTIADLQGLIEGAYSNMGMGHRFLCHVEWTHFLLFVVDINSFRLSPKHPYCSPTENVMLVNKELELYSPDLLSKPALLMVNKMDSPNAESCLQELLHNFKRMEDEYMGT